MKDTSMEERSVGKSREKKVKQTGRKTDRQTDRQKDRQKDRRISHSSLSEETSFLGLQIHKG
jgi:hypothetical protein